MLPERAFQPRGRGMTLEGGGGGIIGGIVDVVKDVGNFIDDKIIQPIVKDPLSAVATVVGATLGGPVGAGVANTVAGLVQGESPKEAITGGVVSGLTAGAGQALLGGTPTVQGPMDAVSAAEWFGGPGAATAPGDIFGSVAPALPSVTGIEGFGAAADQVGGALSGTYVPGIEGFGAASDQVYQGARTSPAVSLKDAFQSARLISGLLTPEQQQIQQQQIGNIPQGGVDYSTLLGLLSQRAGATGLLGTRFQPQPINIASLLG